MVTFSEFWVTFNAILPPKLDIFKVTDPRPLNFKKSKVTYLDAGAPTKLYMLYIYQKIST